MRFVQPYLACLAAILALSTGPAAQTVLVVDDDKAPGVDYNTIADAVTNAPDGAIILVRDGLYSQQVSVDGKSVSLVADEGAAPRIGAPGFVSVTGLALGQRFSMTGIVIDSTFSSANSAVFTDNQGTIWIENCEIDGGAPAVFSNGGAMVITDCDSVVFQDCTIRGGLPGTQLGAGGIAVKAVDSALYFYGSDLTGGTGATSTGTPQTGGEALQLNGGFAFAAHTSFTGGEGGAGGNVFVCIDGGDGGTAVSLLGNAPAAEFYDVTLTGGAGGVPATLTAGCDDGAPGAPTMVAAGTLNQNPLVPHDMEVAIPVQQGQLTPVQFTGQAGEFAWLIYGADPISLYLPSVSGALTTGLPFFFLPAGTLDGSGSVTLTIEGPLLPPMADGMVWYLQSFFLGLSGGFLLGPGNALVVLR